MAEQAGNVPDVPVEQSLGLARPPKPACGIYLRARNMSHLIVATSVVKHGLCPHNDHQRSDRRRAEECEAMAARQDAFARLLDLITSRGLSLATRALSRFVLDLTRAGFAPSFACGAHLGSYLRSTVTVSQRQRGWPQLALWSVVISWVPADVARQDPSATSSQTGRLGSKPLFLSWPKLG